MRFNTAQVGAPLYDEGIGVLKAGVAVTEDVNGIQVRTETPQSLTFRMGGMCKAKLASISGESPKMSYW